MDVAGRCILEITEENVVYLVIKDNNGTIKLFKECNECFVILKVSDLTHNCEDTAVDEGYSD